MNDKRQLRQKIKQLKQALSPEQRAELSGKICAAIASLPGFDETSRIMLYHALPDEVDTSPMLTAWHERKQFYLPVVRGNDLIVSPYSPQSIKQGAFGIWEPSDIQETDPASMEWIIVPGVAFDRRANRLGRGKGFYDRLLAQTHALKIGIGYDLQLLDEIPCEPHDIKMDMIVTENNIIYKKQ